jgi:glycosyltransferase involved in cell wall biosynthesis
MESKINKLPAKPKNSNLKSCWIITPTYNDHDSTLILINKISNLATKLLFKIVVIDDASTLAREEFARVKNFQPHGSVSEFFFYELGQNVGNQGAIAFGLKKALTMANVKDLFVVMDSDGEDKPEDIIELISAYKEDVIVVAQRAREKSHFILMLWHRLFKLVLKSLTGKILNFGNFSLMDYASCKRIVMSKKIDLSYVGCILQSNLDLNRIKIHRGKRYKGESRTSRDSLLIWGFQILSVFSEVIFAKLLRLSVVFGFVSLLGICLIVWLKLFTGLTIPGWSGVMIAILATSILQTVVMLSGFIMIQSQSTSVHAENVLERHN